MRASTDGLVLPARHESILPVGDEIRPAFPEAHVVFERVDVHLEPVGALRPKQPFLQKFFGVRDRSFHHALEFVHDDADAA
jgi:hypothetical protein